jgi:uncharacterized membrane protein
MPSNKVERLEKFKTITTEVYALSLGLGAFSLATIPREGMLDVVGAVIAFAIAFFYIAVIWMTHSRFFEDYPLYDDIFLGLNFVVLFLVAISPYIMQIMFTSSELLDPISIMCALDMVAIYLILGYFHQRYLQQNKDIKPKQKRMVKVQRNIQAITALWFLVSTQVPITYRITFWWVMAPVIPIYRIFIAPRHIK